MRSATFLFLLLYSTCSLANITTARIDSLTRLLEAHPINNEHKVDLLNQLGYAHWIVDPVQSIIYGKRAQTISDKLSYPEGTAFSNRIIGVAYWAIGDLDDASKYLFESVTHIRHLMINSAKRMP